MKPSDIIQQFGLETSTDENDFLIAADCAIEHELAVFGGFLQSQVEELLARKGETGPGYGFDESGRVTKEIPQGQKPDVMDTIGYGFLFEDSDDGSGAGEGYGDGNITGDGPYEDAYYPEFRSFGYGQGHHDGQGWAFGWNSSYD